MKQPLALLLLAALAACSAEKSREAAAGVSLLENFSMAESLAGSSRWRLDSALGRLDEKKGVIAFESPKIKFYEGGRVTSEITALSGVLQMKDNSAELTDDVVIDAKRDGMQLKTTKLYYSSARGKVWTEEPVTIYKGRTVIKGRGFTANPDLSEIEIQRQETRLSGT
ncbi:MAG: LPS export ABC transporter periplasmic protein LptC [Elusimicrobia bacterium GWB2_63_22]|nr:MAG: LPS export ABC transporter periplasmic protein LptC [Elusimicrobia bacterium GWB2_63_22]